VTGKNWKPKMVIGFNTIGTPTEKTNNKVIAVDMKHFRFRRIRLIFLSFYGRYVYNMHVTTQNSHAKLQ
jgi:hypothetical protein